MLGLYNDRKVRAWRGGLAAATATYTKAELVNLPIVTFGLYASSICRSFTTYVTNTLTRHVPMCSVHRYKTDADLAKCI